MRKRRRPRPQPGSCPVPDSRHRRLPRMPGIDSVLTTTTSAPLRPLMGCSGSRSRSGGATISSAPASCDPTAPRPNLTSPCPINNLASTSWRLSAGHALRRAPQHSRDPPRTDRSRHCRRRPHRHQFVGPLRRTRAPGPCRRPQAAGGAEAATSVASSWPSTACSPTSVTRSSGSCATASPARSSWPEALLSSTAKDLAGRITEVRKAVPVPITGVTWTAKAASGKAVAKAQPGVPHQLCHFHFISKRGPPSQSPEADRHA